MAFLGHARAKVGYDGKLGFGQVTFDGKYVGYDAYIRADSDEIDRVEFFARGIFGESDAAETAFIYHVLGERFQLVNDFVSVRAFYTMRDGQQSAFACF